jgi:hypothetical protein
MTENWNGGLRHLVLRTEKNRLQSGWSFRNRIKALLHTAEGRDCCALGTPTQAMQGSGHAEDRGKP